MKLPHKIFAVVAAFAALSVAVFAQNMVGTWNGKVQLDASKMPKGQTPEQQKQIDMGIAMAKKVRLTVNLKGNNTYVLTVSGIPGMPKMTKPASEGTWKLQGSKLFMTSLKENGQPSPKGKKPQMFVVAKGGKSFHMDAPGGGPMGGRVIFTR